MRAMIKDRLRRLDLIYINQPLYFVTFATRDKRRVSSARFREQTRFKPADLPENISQTL